MKNTREGRQGTTTRDRHRKIIARGQPPCGICGDPIDYGIPYPHPGSFTVDHVTPINRGGTDELFDEAGNIQKQAAHSSCNRAKSDRLAGEPAGRKRNAYTHVTTRCWW